MHNPMEKYRDEMTEDIRRLVRVKSVKSAPLPGAPFGDGCRDVLEHALKIGGDMGFAVKNVDNYAGHVEYGDGDEIVGILAHLDVVPEGDGWDVPPYEAVVRSGKIIGRGSADNKGPAVAAFYCLKEIRDAGIPIKRRVRVILGADEESGSSDMKYYFEREPLPAYGFSPDAAYPVINREKGIIHLLFKADGTAGDGAILSIQGGVARNSVPDMCRARVDLARVADTAALEKRISRMGGVIESRVGNILTIYRAGISAHGASPHLGDNAVMRMLDILSPLFACDSETCGASRFLRFLYERLSFETDGASLGIKACDAPSGNLSLNLGTLSVDENHACASADIRFPVTHSALSIVHTAKAVAAGYGVRCETATYTPPLYVHPDAPLIRTLQSAYESVTGEPATLLSMGGGTYARALKNRGVAFGPSFPGDPSSRIHEANEFLEIDRLLKHAHVCLEAVVRLANL